MRRGNPVVLAQAVGRADLGGFLPHAGVEVAGKFALAKQDTGLLVAQAALHQHAIETQEKLARIRTLLDLGLG